jgi:hypothetical protein
LSTLGSLLFTILICSGIINVFDNSIWDINSRADRDAMNRVRGAAMIPFVTSFLISSFLYLYFIYILYSFVKNVGLGNLELVQGFQMGYVQQSNTNNYMPPNQNYNNNASPNQNNTYVPVSTQLSQPIQNQNYPTNSTPMMQQGGQPHQNYPTGSTPMMQQGGQPYQNYPTGSAPLLQPVGPPQQQYPTGSVPILQPIGEPQKNYQYYQPQNINDYNNMSRIVLNDPNDIAFTQISQNAIVTEATLPSGFNVPAAPYGKNWIIRQNEIILI